MKKFNIIMNFNVKIFLIIFLCISLLLSIPLVSNAADAPEGSINTVKVPPKVGGKVPTFPPLDGEFYPTDPKKYPEKIESQYAKPRTVTFTGNPIEIYTKLNMLTRLVFPEPPIRVNIGDTSAFIVETNATMMDLVIKPVSDVAMTNLIVLTENNEYLFILKETPYSPWDFRVKVVVGDVGDEHLYDRDGGSGNGSRHPDGLNTQGLITTAVNGVVPQTLRYEVFDVRTPLSRVTQNTLEGKVSMRILLKRAVNFSFKETSIYWFEISNTANEVPTKRDIFQNFIVDETSVRVKGLAEVVVPGTEADMTPLLSEGLKLDMFLIVKGEKVLPPVIDLQFIYYPQSGEGYGNMVYATLPTAQGKIRPPELKETVPNPTAQEKQTDSRTIEERLMDEYNKSAERRGQQTKEELDFENSQKQENQDSSNTGGAGQSQNNNQGNQPKQPPDNRGSDGVDTIYLPRINKK